MLSRTAISHSRVRARVTLIPHPRRPPTELGTDSVPSTPNRSRVVHGSRVGWRHVRGGHPSPGLADVFDYGPSKSSKTVHATIAIHRGRVVENDLCVDQISASRPITVSFWHPKVLGILPFRVRISMIDAAVTHRCNSPALPRSLSVGPPDQARAFGKPSMWPCER